MAIKFAVIALLGAPPVAVLIFEILLNACAMFNHANVALPRWLDAALRRVVVTPDMHVVHHSVLPAETDSNFGFCLSWWDRLFATYRAAPSPGVDRMTIGLAQFRHPQEARLDRLLTQPFRQDQTVSAP
jgi:sterol desaturase/sphingolipid hydroxylase (fatty acid hydroxylase superfamily)